MAAATATAATIKRGGGTPWQRPQKMEEKNYRCYYPHRLTDSVSPVCGIFLNILFKFTKNVVVIINIAGNKRLTGCVFFISGIQTKYTAESALMGGISS